jgi:predicted metalloprotease
MGFGRQTGVIRDAWFTPGFRNGKPVACEFTWTLGFEGAGRQMNTG